MPRDASIDALRRYVKGASAKKARDVLEAVDRLVARGDPVTVARVARHAGVSREFIYSNERLRDAVRSGASKVEEASLLASDAHMNSANRADRGALAKRIDRQKAQIETLEQKVADLEKQRSRWLGRQVSDAEYVNPETHAELRVMSSRLMDENTSLGRRVAELQRQNRILEGELAASRTAHAEDVARLSEGDRVVALETARSRRDDHRR